MTCALVIAVSQVSAASGAAEVAASSADGRAQALVGRVSAPEKCPHARKAVRFYLRRANDWRERMGASQTQTSRATDEWKSKRRAGSSPCTRVRRLAEVWRWKAWVARYNSERWFERTLEKWRCIHEHEGAWNDPNPTYYGGLQMDLSFQKSHGREFYDRWGTADKWPVWAQLLAAEDAYKTRGFGPWPTYYRYCS